MARRGILITFVPLKICITGGTGFVGRVLTRQLLDAGHGVRLVVRRPPRPVLQARRFPMMPDFATADFSSSASLSGAFRGHDAVIHLIGIIGELGSQTFERVHTDLSRTVMEATRDAGVRRLLHMSALGTGAQARSRYHQSKWAAEEIVRRSGLDWTLFRPSLIHGREDGFTRLFARISAWSPVVPLLGSGSSLLQPIAVEQVARAFVGALGLPEAVGRSYDLCGTERLTLHEVIRTLLEAEGRRRCLFRVPMGVARAWAGVLEATFPPILRRAPPFSRDQLLMLEEGNIGDGGPADRAFGLVHRRFADDMRRLAGRAGVDLAVDPAGARIIDNVAPGRPGGAL